jgi:hypothetical protein
MRTKMEILKNFWEEEERQEKLRDEENEAALEREKLNELKKGTEKTKN